MRITGIYKIQSKVKPDRIYIGSAINISERWGDHLKKLRKNKHANSKLQSHYNKYKESDLQFSVLLSCERCDLLKTEQYFIDSYNPWFNICKNAGSVLGLKKTIESRKKQSELFRGEKHPMFGKRHTIESKGKMSIGHKGQKAWNKGKKGVSETVSKKMKDAWLSRNPISEATRKKMSISHSGEKNGMYGKKQSEESKRKNRESQLGEKGWHYGRHHSQESRNKVSIAKKEYWRLKKQNSLL